MVMIKQSVEASTLHPQSITQANRTKREPLALAALCRTVRRPRLCLSFVRWLWLCFCFAGFGWVAWWSGDPARSLRPFPAAHLPRCPLPFALCPLPTCPGALCPLPFALCPLPFALWPSCRPTPARLDERFACAHLADHHSWQRES
jgi:hypothetical protein